MQSMTMYSFQLSKYSVLLIFYMHRVENTGKVVQSIQQSQRHDMISTIEKTLKLSLGLFLVGNSNQFLIKPSYAAAATEEMYIDALSTMILAKEVIKPTNIAVEVQVSVYS
jgi:hypothetical protein